MICENATKLVKEADTLQLNPYNVIYSLILKELFNRGDY